MLPESVVGTKGNQCTQSTKEFCGNLGIKGPGCQFKPDPRASPSASPRAAKSDANQQKENEENEESANRKRNIILGSTAAGALLLTIAAFAGYFIIRPWLRNDISSNGGDFECEYDDEQVERVTNQSASEQGAVDI